VGRGVLHVTAMQPVKKKARKATASEAQRDPWGHALQGPGAVEVPYLPPPDSAAAAAATPATPPRYPVTVAQRLRHRVFCELHERGSVRAFRTLSLPLMVACHPDSLHGRRGAALCASPVSPSARAHSELIVCGCVYVCVCTTGTP
jgi:hypothetical protein